MASTVPELPGLFGKHNLAEESIDELVQGNSYLFARFYSFIFLNRARKQ